jgi:uncharacterized protein
VLVYAHREDAPDHTKYRSWLERVWRTEPAVGLADLVLSGFVRVVTHPRVFTRPTPTTIALEAASGLRSLPNAVPLGPGPLHWGIFQRLCLETSAKGNLVADAYLAALAIEAGGEWITTDRDYSRFKNLRWRHPLS